jgi:RIO-like serine/threonine protein kinase
MLSTAEQSVLGAFRQYLMGPGEMLCFHGKFLEEHTETLRRLTARKLISKEKFKGGYSLTATGFSALQPQRQCIPV